MARRDMMQSIFGQMVRVLAAVNGFLLAAMTAGVVTLSTGVVHASDRPVHIVAFGDSLTAGYMLTAKEAFPAQLERKLRAAGFNVTITNAGVSGDTTAGGLARLDWSVPDGADAVILELGANDALRGLDPKQARANLDAIIERLKGRGVDVLLAGMMAPANYGEAYANAFNGIFPALAKKHDLLFYPFFLQGVALRQNLNLGDGLHPNSEGVAKIVDAMMPTVEQLIRRAEARRRAGGRG